MDTRTGEIMTDAEARKRLLQEPALREFLKPVKSISKWRQAALARGEKVYHSPRSRCPCGSGKRFKSCCMTSGAAMSVDTNKPSDAMALLLALENIYLLARRKRCVIHRYVKDVAIPIGPKSEDADWDVVIKWCEQAGLKPRIIRTAKAVRR